MAQKFADLHVHTHASDGESSPEEVVKAARDAGLAAIGIADHDSVDGIEPALDAGEKYGVEVIPGIELSSELVDSEVHVLGYFINWRDEQFRVLLRIIQDVRKWRARKMVEKLQGLGIDITYEEVLAEAGKAAAVCRPHIARVMLRHGYIKNFQDAFDLYLKSDKPAYVKRYEMSPSEAIDIIRRVKGIPVMAHPVFAQADEIIPAYIEMGLRGLEVYHIKHDEATSKHYEELAQRYGLLVTGGTDSHGPDEPIGATRIPYEYVERLKAERKV
ncbi:MAG: PHP domain-containing protein [Hadesarchaea archaeon]|nr:PHP domain-containing protein [Hadesarchaea archaeon]